MDEFRSSISLLKIDSSERHRTIDAVALDGGIVAGDISFKIFHPERFGKLSTEFLIS